MPFRWCACPIPISSFTDGSVVIRNARFAARTLQFAENEGYFRCFAKAKTAPTLYRGEDSNVWYLTELSRTPASYTLTFAENGVTKGMTATNFGPYLTATRGQIVCFIYRWFAK